MDNGFCSFDRVRIPRGNMAMRHQQVDRDGVYTSTGSKDGGKIAYITVMQASNAVVGSTIRVQNSICVGECNVPQEVRTALLVDRCHDNV